MSEQPAARIDWLTPVMLFAPLAVFAEALLVKTHHRPLGAATFASVAVILWFAASLVSERVLDAELSSARALARRVAWIGSSFAALLVVARLAL